MSIYTHDKIGLPECPYVERWILDFRIFSIRLHHWMASDDQRYFHDHPWWYFTLIVRGGYTDISPKGNDPLTFGSIRFRPALHQHTVKVDPGGAVSLLITGSEKREWGFWVNGKFKKRNRYFFNYKHHPCDPK